MPFLQTILIELKIIIERCNKSKYTQYLTQICGVKVVTSTKVIHKTSTY